MDSHTVCKWIEEHPLIKVRKLAELIGCQPPNFYNYLKLQDIPEKYLLKIVDVLKDYGLADDIPTLSRQKDYQNKRFQSKIK